MRRPLLNREKDALETVRTAMRRPNLNRWKHILLLAGLTEREAAAICSDIAREMKAGQERKEAA